MLWRAEVDLLDEADVGEDDLLKVLRRYRPRAAERLRVPTSDLVPSGQNKVGFLLQRLAGREATAADPQRAIVLNVDGAFWLTLTEARLRAAERDGELRNATLVLPTSFGGLGEGGTLDPTADADPGSARRGRSCGRGATPCCSPTH